MIDQHFGPALTVGVEEELWILDGDTLELAPGVQQLIAGVEGRTLPGTLKTELHASVVEVTNAIGTSSPSTVRTPAGCPASITASPTIRH